MLLAYQLPLPGLFLKSVAIVLPWMELLCGLPRLEDQAPRRLAWALILFMVFALCTGQAWARGLRIDCGCLDLSLLGVRTAGSATAEFFESPGFALIPCAMALAAAAVGLLRQRDKPAAATNPI